MKLIIIEQNENLRSDIKNRVEEASRLTGLKSIIIDAIDMKQLGSSTPDLIILGDFAKDKILEIHSRINSIHPNTPIILLLGTSDYLEDSIELYKRTQIRIVAQGDIPQLTQIILNLSQPTSLQNNISGKARIISVIGIKGGAGITSLTASLASFFESHEVSSLLIDLNHINRDLSSFSNYSIEGQHALSKLYRNSQPLFSDINPCIEKFRQTKSGLISIIGATESFIEAYELFTNSLPVFQTNSVWLESNISTLADEFETIIIDLGNHWGPATLSILSMSSNVCLMMEDDEWSIKRNFEMLHKISSESEDPTEFDFRKWKVTINGIKIPEETQEVVNLYNSNYNIIKTPIIYGIPWSKRCINWFLGNKTPYECGESSYKNSIEDLAKSIRSLD